MEEQVKIRIDKWLWAVRLFKTRSMASEACDKGRIKIGDVAVKASRFVRAGDVVQVHRGPWSQLVKVLAPTEKRMSASLSKGFCEDITPVEELEKYKLHQAAQAAWNITPGAGRPTKKDRRQMDDFVGDW
jgi:ribosome-associated heat shock protein Hsp15